MKVVIVTGSRIIRKRSVIWGALSFHAPTLLVHGAAYGADLIAESWAIETGCDYHGVPARWRPDGPAGRYDNGAGHKRNDRMLRLHPGALVLAFPAGEAKGTNGCIARALVLGHEVWTYDEQGNHEIKRG